MASIRRTKTASGATAIQIVEYKNRKVVVLKHIGSGRTTEELLVLQQHAEEWIETKKEYQLSLFPQGAKMIPLSALDYTGVSYQFAYETLHTVLEHMGFMEINSSLLLDLAIMRIIEPSSKLRMIEFLKRYFGITYSERTVYRTLQTLHTKKKEVEQVATSFAQKKLGDDLSIILYDVTTLYFETFKQDELRVPGFSKDNKSQQPQIVVGLLVTKEGFPVGYDIFEGNTFEGKTMLTVLQHFSKRHHTKTPTVVADAAMLSFTNIEKLKAEKYCYIVGARTGNLSLSVIKDAHKEICRKDGKSIRFATSHGDLIIAFSKKRYLKNKKEMENQIAKAKILISKGEPGKRAKFVSRKDGKDMYTLNKELQKKTEFLLGMKGYYTNIPEQTLSNEMIITRYHDLWHVEATFRMAKSDLATRPIFHHKKEAVKAHMVICFIALAMSKYLELSTKLSIRKIIDMLWTVTDAHLVNTVTGENIILRSNNMQKVKKIFKHLSY